MVWAPDYAEVSDLADYVRINDSQDDVPLARAISAASRSIDFTCNRQFGGLTTVANRYYTAFWDHRVRRWTVDIDDLMTTVGLVIMFDSGDDGAYESEIDDFQLQHVNAQADGKPWTRVVVHPNSSVQPNNSSAAVEITAKWGWASVPDAVHNACLLQASRLFARRNSPYGVAGSPENGSELRLLAKVDADVEVMLRPYRRIWGAV